ncbi:death domain-containing protein 1 [Lingula anatina]|uniref:Death domain-containing protein 1 n=1 Tax=Lingula anatina TaxID=7574 RepID=A0A1S3HDZ3_LINAN|nr:death domain-containing protein 1 [Lingula anatina]|eukprot:XP_013383289.1 death domain-containing protein 1 [Lingula anatina]
MADVAATGDEEPKDHSTSEIIEESTDYTNSAGNDADKVQENEIPSQENHDANIISKGESGESTGGDKFQVNFSLSIDSQLLQIQDFMVKHHQEVASAPLKDYSKLEELKQWLSEAVKVYQNCVNHAKELSSKIGEVRSIVSNFRTSISGKIEHEGLKSWLSKEAGSQDCNEIAEEKSVLSWAASVKSDIAKVAVELAEANELAGQAASEAADAAIAADTALKEAKNAAKAAAEAAKAAEEKARADEEARIREEEKRKKKEEEERKKREEEEKKRKELESIKGTPEEIERQKEEEERKRQEAERRDPNNWPLFTYRYNEEQIDFDLGIMAVVRSMPWTMDPDDEESLQCKKLNQLDSTLTIAENEELVSNIVEIVPSSEKVVFKFEEPLAVAIPHCAQKVSSRELAVKYLETGKDKWRELPSQEIILQDLREAKFVQCRLKTFGQFAVVTRLKLDRLVPNKKDGKMSSTVDQRLVLHCRPGTVPSTATFGLQVQPVDSFAISELKVRLSEDCGPLLTCSPIVRFQCSTSKFKKPIQVTIPCPPNPKAKRPQTARPKEKEGKSTRPSSAFSLGLKQKAEDDDLEDTVFLLTRTEGDEGWIVMADIDISESKKKDAVIFEITKPYDRFMALRLKHGAGGMKAQKLANLIETALQKRTVRAVLRQKSDDPSDVSLQCLAANKIDKALRKMTEEGFDDGPPASKDLVLTEGQELFLRFRGNIQCEDEEEILNFCFNSQLKSGVNIYVTEIDKFAQKSLDCYRGFVQVYTKGMIKQIIKKENEDRDAVGGKSGPKEEVTWVMGDILLCELLVSLPKPEPEAPKPLVQKAPVTFIPDGPVDESVLRNIATDLGDEWKKVAHILNIRKSRVQAILRNNVNSDNEVAIYDMLITWAKKVPRSMDKVELLGKALTSAGRPDLAYIVYEHDDEYRQKRAEDIKDNILRKAFIKICQDSQVHANYVKLSRQLKVTDEQLKNIEGEYDGMREKIFQILVKWRENLGPRAELLLLVKALRRIRLLELSEQVQLVG